MKKGRWFEFRTDADCKPPRQQSIGGVGNYYGGLSVCRVAGKNYWAIEDHDGFRWEEIPDGLYLALLAFEEARANGQG